MFYQGYRGTFHIFAKFITNAHQNQIQQSTAISDVLWCILGLRWGKGWEEYSLSETAKLPPLGTKQNDPSEPVKSQLLSSGYPNPISDSNIRRNVQSQKSDMTHRKKQNRPAKHQRSRRRTSEAVSTLWPLQNPSGFVPCKMDTQSSSAVKMNKKRLKCSDGFQLRCYNSLAESHSPPFRLRLQRNAQILTQLPRCR